MPPPSIPTLDQVDRRLFRVMHSSTTYVCAGESATHNREACLHTLVKDAALSVQPRSVLVRTNSPGKRPASHDIDQSLLRLVLGTIRDVLPTSEIFLGDGPAF